MLPVWFGKDAIEREEYMNISAEGFSAEAMEQEDMDDLPEGFKPKHHKKLATFTLKHVYKYFSILSWCLLDFFKYRHKFRKVLHKISTFLWDLGYLLLLYIILS